jgi:hypothetical protein
MEESLPFETTWMKLEDIMLKDKHWMISLRCEKLKKSHLKKQSSMVVTGSWENVRRTWRDTAQRILNV